MSALTPTVISFSYSPGTFGRSFQERCRCRSAIHGLQATLRRHSRSESQRRELQVVASTVHAPSQITAAITEPNQRSSISKSRASRASRALHCYPLFSMLIFHVTPILSTTMPYQAVKVDLPNGMITSPPTLSAANIRLAVSTDVGHKTREKP